MVCLDGIASTSFLPLYLSAVAPFAPSLDLSICAFYSPRSLLLSLLPLFVSLLTFPLPVHFLNVFSALSRLLCVGCTLLALLLNFTAEFCFRISHNSPTCSFMCVVEKREYLGTALILHGAYEDGNGVLYKPMEFVVLTRRFAVAQVSADLVRMAPLALVSKAV
eukprot:6179908-Pleurochrysis_carterae.AAC.7